MHITTESEYNSAKSEVERLWEPVKVLSDESYEHPIVSKFNELTLAIYEYEMSHGLIEEMVTL